MNTRTASVPLPPPALAAPFAYLPAVTLMTAMTPPPLRPFRPFIPLAPPSPAPMLYSAAMSPDLPALRAVFDQEVRLDIEYPGTEKDVLLNAAGQPRLVRFSRPAPGRSFILYQHFAAAEADAEIDAQLAYFSERQLPFDWRIFAHDTPADLPARLTARGWIPEDPDAIMLLDLATAPATLLAPVTADVRAITTRAQLADVITVMEGVWGGDFSWINTRLGDHLDIPGYLEIYAAYVDDTPASAAWVYLPPHTQFASLWAGSTVSPYRGQGLYTALLATRVQSAQRRGYRYLVVSAGPMSQPIVARHGFTQLTTAQYFEPPTAPAT